MKFISLIILTPSICLADVLVSMYQAPSDQNKTVVECTFTDGRKDVRLLVKNDDLETYSVVSWFDEHCQEGVDK